MTTLQTYIYKLRKIFVEHGAGDVLSTRPGGYMLTVPDSSIDLARFEQAAGEGQALLEASDPARAADVLTGALAGWRGPALVDVVPGGLLASYVTALEESRSRTLELRIEADLQLGRHRELISELKSLVLTHPLHEHLHASLMVALHHSGRRQLWWTMRYARRLHDTMLRTAAIITAVGAFILLTGSILRVVLAIEAAVWGRSFSPDTRLAVLDLIRLGTPILIAGLIFPSVVGRVASAWRWWASSARTANWALSGARCAGSTLRSSVRPFRPINHPPSPAARGPDRRASAGPRTWDSRCRAVWSNAGTDTCGPTAFSRRAARQRRTSGSACSSPSSKLVPDSLSTSRPPPTQSPRGAIDWPRTPGS